MKFLPSWRTAAALQAEFSNLYLVQSQGSAFSNLKLLEKGCREHEDR